MRLSLRKNLRLVVVYKILLFTLMSENSNRYFVSAFQSSIPSTSIRQFNTIVRNFPASTYDRTQGQYFKGNSRTAPLSFSKRNDNDDDDKNNSGILSTLQSTISSNGQRSALFSLLMIGSGAILGPFLDSYHSAFGVLQYDSPITAQLWSTNPEIPALITSWWVPPLFGLAGFLIGWLYILYDSIFLSLDKGKTNLQRPQPEPPRILVGISIFTFQYWLSGVLTAQGVDRTTILNIMSVVAAIGFAVLDNTLAGLITSASTAIGGPLIEVGLISYFASIQYTYGYHYTDAGETGFFPLWILPVYFLGGPAVGNLARGFWNALSPTTVDESVKTNQESKPPAGCEVCNDTRRVPCPNCEGMGTYVAMGGRSVKCTSCQGRGFVICRSCFSYYDDVPNDVASIRDFMSRMPD